MAIKVSGTEVISDDKRILNNESLPDIRPSLLLDFANSKTLDPRITFTRGSTATYWDGKTTAKAEENLLTYSQNMTLSPWVGSGTTRTANTTTAPDGTATANTVEITTEGAYRNVAQSPSGFASTTYTASVYLKKSNWDYVRVNMQSRTSGNGYIDTISSRTINLSNGATVDPDIGTATTTDVGNGWYRVTFSGTSAGNAQTIFVDASFADSTGNGAPATNIASGSEFFIWGFQLEQRSSATAYTPTTSSPIVKYQPVLQTAASGEARFDHDPVTGESKGLLIEEARTNILPYSEAFDNAEFQKVNAIITANSVVAPDGTLTADTFIADTTSGEHYIQDNLTAATGTFTDSVYAKSSGDYFFAIRPVHAGADEGTTRQGYFDLNTGTVHSNTSGTTATIEDVGNGWYRCSLTYTVSGTLSGSYGARFQLYGNDGSGGIVSLYAGDNHSGVYLWGAQREVGSFPTSYIPTSGSTVTRSQDLAIVNNFDTIAGSSVFGLSGYVQVEHVEDAGNIPVGFVDASNSFDYSTYILSRYLSGEAPEFYLRNGGSAVANLSVTLTGTNKTVNYGFAASREDVAFTANGLTPSTSTTATPPQWVKMSIGLSPWGNDNEINGYIKKIAFYPKRLPNATLQAMTEE